MYFNLTGLIQGNLCGIFLQTENCGLSNPEVLEWTIPPSSVPKPPVTEWTAPPVFHIFQLDNLYFIPRLRFHV